jgi:hypothetical protein
MNKNSGDQVHMIYSLAWIKMLANVPVTCVKLGTPKIRNKIQAASTKPAPQMKMTTRMRNNCKSVRWEFCLPYAAKAYLFVFQIHGQIQIIIMGVVVVV